MTTVPEPGLTVVVPVKSLDRAKSRLALPRRARVRVALELMLRSVGVALGTPSVSTVLVVTDDPVVDELALSMGASVVADPGGGLNLAAGAGRRHAGRTHPGHHIGIMVADLPRLTAEDLETAIAEYLHLGSPMFVADHPGCGTTMLLHPPGDEPPLLFGEDSAERHRRAGYFAATAPLPGLRQDLDRLPLPT